MADIQELIEILQKAINKADDVAQANKEMEKKAFCEIAIVRAYLDRKLNQIERIARAA